MFKKAEKVKSKARVILAGPAGAGKTFSALKLAFGLVGPNGKVGVLDTDNGRAKMYSRLGEYAVEEMGAPFTTGKIISVVEMAQHLGFDALIVDSLSPFWAGEGGILERVDKMVSTGGDKRSVWLDYQSQHNDMIRSLLKSDLHIIVTLRTKMETIVTEKFSPKRVGLTTIQRDGIEYDFDIVFDLDADSHTAVCSKDHGVFGRFADVLTEEHGRLLRTWLDDGVSPDVKTGDSEQPAEAAEKSAATASYTPTALFINEEQIVVLKGLLSDTGTDLKKFLNYFKVDKMEAFPAARFAQAKEMLEAKKGEEGKTGERTEDEKPQGTSSTSTENQNWAETLKARNIPFKEGEDGILATPGINDRAAQAFLRSKGFKWDKSAKAWRLAA